MSGELIDTYLLFLSLNIPFTFVNVVLFHLICFVVMVIIVFLIIWKWG